MDKYIFNSFLAFRSVHSNKRKQITKFQQKMAYLAAKNDRLPNKRIFC